MLWHLGQFDHYLGCYLRNVFLLVSTSPPDNYQVMLTVSRIGAYGDVNVNWEAGYPSGSVPSGFTEGIITPRSGQVRFSNGQSRRTVTVGVSISWYSLKNVTGGIDCGASLLKLHLKILKGQMS